MAGKPCRDRHARGDRDVVDYRQRLARTDFKRTYTWVEDEAEAHNFYAPPKDDYPPFSFEIAHEEMVPFVGTVPVVLDRDHNLSVGFLGDPYSWDLQETFVDAQGRILGLVVVYLGSAPPGVVPVFQSRARAIGPRLRPGLYRTRSIVRDVVIDRPLSLTSYSARFGRLLWRDSMRIRARQALLLPVFLVLLTSPARTSGLTRYVNHTDSTCGGHAPCYTTIQAAINAALAGETIVVQAGTYVEQVLIQGKNNTAGANEADRIVLQADPIASPGSVVLDGASAVCTNGQAIRLQQSKFITIRGLTITGSGGQAVQLMGGNNQNQAIHLERLRIFGNGGSECDGGITIARGNPDTLIVNSLIYGNGRNGIVTIDADGGPHYIVGNTIHGNAWSGVSITRSHEAFLVNNSITGNGTAAGSTGGRFGVKREDSTSPTPAGIHLLNNLICGNRLGEIDGPALDSTDSGNLTPTGAEGPGVSVSAGCGNPTTVYASLAGPDGVLNTSDDAFALATGSPAIDRGMDPRTLGLSTLFNPLFAADYLGDAARPRAGGTTGPAKFDVGAVEFVVPDTQAPIVTFLQPAASAFVRQTVTVQAQATDDTGVVSLALMVNAQPLSATLSPTPPAPSVTATATLNTTTLPDGTHTLGATAADKVPNSASASRVVIVDNTPPSVQVTSGPSGTTSATSATFTFTGSDNLTSVGNLQFAWQMDGAAFTEFAGATTASFSNLAAGAHTFTAKARDQAGNESVTASRTFTVSSLQVVITSPVSGATVPIGSLLVRGTVSAGGAEVGVTVNATSVAVQGTSFTALVPITSTTTTLTAVATTASGATAQHTVSVTSTASAGPFTLRALPTVGVAPATVSFSVSGGPTTGVNLDANGDGVTDLSVASLDGQSFIYMQPGVYVATATVTDSQGNVFTAQAVVQVVDRASLNTLFLAKWAILRDALARGDIEGALSVVAEGEKPKYRGAFQRLVPNLPAVAATLRDIRLLGFDGVIAEYGTTKDRDGGTFVHLIYFMQDADGIWKIVAM